MLSPRSKCMSLVWLLHVQETLYCDIYLLFASDLVVLINLTFAVFPLFRFSEGEEKKKYIRLFASTLPHPLLPSPLLSSAVFALFRNVLRCTGRYLGCSRLDCYTDQQRASACFLFVWHAAHLPWQPSSTLAHRHAHKGASKAEALTAFCCLPGRWLCVCPGPERMKDEK